ncbi:MLO-like protein 8 [Dionaea muscipula]
MAGASSSSGERTLAQTPTWAVAGVCLVIIVISIALEKILHGIGKVFIDRHKRALYEALEKLKAELMVLGFISLILSFSQNYIADICIPSGLADNMLACKLHKQNNSSSSSEEHHRRLLWNEHRFLTSTGPVSHCKSGYEPLISISGIHQLHILIFFLAVFQVICSAMTMALGRLQIRHWKHWELETSSNDYQISSDPSRFRFTHETSFIKAHNNFSMRNPFLFYVGCFFRQFFRSVTKADYLTLRNGFIKAHIAPGSRFNFQKYIKRSLEDDFQVVVGISPVLWASFVIFLLLNVEGWDTLFWTSFIPLIIILAVGTKLQSILAKMALETIERHAVVQGIPLVQASDRYFWFSRPHLMLHLIHFTLFQNAFRITYFWWIWYEYGLRSCFHDNMTYVAIKLAVEFFSLCLCSYITLPLYALVTQMGSHMKRSVFDEQTGKALKNWHRTVKKKKHHQVEIDGKSPHGPSSFKGSSMGSPVQSTGRTLRRLKTTGPLTRSSFPYEDHEKEDPDADSNGDGQAEITLHITDEEIRSENDDLSFSNFAPTSKHLEEDLRL